MRLHARARRAHATLRRDQRLSPDAWAELALGIPARLEDLARSPVVIGRARAPDPEAGGQICPYCRDAAEGDVRPCASCRTLHHTECFAEAGGCTVLGCAAAPRRGPLRMDVNSPRKERGGALARTHGRTKGRASAPLRRSSAPPGSGAAR